MCSKVGDGGSGVNMREGTTSRVTAADRLYGEFYGFYSISPENFESTHVLGFDLTPGRLSHEEHRSMPRQGNVRIEARFK